MSLFNKENRKAGEIISFDVVTLRTSGMRYVSEYEIVMKDGMAELSLYGIRFAQGEDERVLEKRAVFRAKVLEHLPVFTG